MPPRKRKNRVIEVETPPDVTKRERWQQRVARSQRVRTDWERMCSVIEGEKFFVGVGDDGERLKFNHFAATIKTSRPNLFFSSPKFYVRPQPGRKQPVAERKAAVGEGVLEAIARHDDNLETAGGFATLQGYFRIGVLKVVYDPRMEPNPKAGEPMVETINGEPVIDPETQAPKLLRHPLTGKVVVEPDEVLTDETYRWAWVDAANMLLPDEGPDPSKWTWIGEEVIVPLSVAKDDPRFPKDKRARLRGNLTHAQARERGVTATSVVNDGDDPWFKYYEVYDYREKELLIWAEGQDDNTFLVDEPIPAWIDNDPYALLFLGEPIMGPNPSPWPVPVVKDWLPIQMEYELRRKQITGGAGRSARKVLYVEGVFPDEDDARKALQSPIDMEAVKVSNASEDKLRILADPDLNGSIYKDTAMLQGDWRIITGQTGARMSDPDSGTATEASFVERAAGLRDADMQKAVTRWLAAAGRKMLQCVRETLTLEMWVAYKEITDKEIEAYFQRVYQMPPEIVNMFPALKSSIRAQFGQQKWQSVTREELIFEADVTVAPGSTRPKSLDAERRAWVEVLKIIGAAPQLALSRKLLEYTLAKFEIEDESLVEELFMLANQMVQVNANQAGRNQGAAGVGGSNGGVTDATSAVLAGVNGGSR
ncbi:MAG TPA: hypothetical protein VEA38_22070 [Terriglobales bacterium]|nr:hypothetical protein [Terriglobales bacterium]